MKKISVLVLSRYMICPPISGGAKRMLFAPMHLSESDGIEFTYMYISSCEEERVKNIDYLNHIKLIKQNHSTVVMTDDMFNTSNMPKGFSNETWYAMSRSFKDDVLQKVSEKEFDIIQIEHTQMAWIIPYLRIASPKSKIVLDHHNLEWLVFKRQYEYAPEIERAHIFDKYTTLKNWEDTVLDWFDAIFCISPVEKEIIEKMTDAKVYYAPTGAGIDDDEYLPKNSGGNKKYDMVFIGTMEWFPNAHAIQWFLKEVMPIIMEKKPHVKLELIGSGTPDPDMLALIKKFKNITFWGAIQDEKPLLHESKVFISPIWIGAGVRLKNPTAWAAKIPVVATTLSVEGLEYTPGYDLLIGDTPQEFAQAVLRLLDDEQFSNEIVENAYRTYKDHYSSENIVSIWKKLYWEVASDISE